MTRIRTKENQEPRRKIKMNDENQDQREPRAKIKDEGLKTVIRKQLAAYSKQLNHLTLITNNKLAINNSQPVIKENSVKPAHSFSIRIR